MQNKSNQFIPAAEIAINDTNLHTAVSFATGSAFNKRQAAMYAYGNVHGEALRQQAAAVKRRTLQNLPDLLEQAEANMQANGITVLWAADAEEANQHVLSITRKHQTKLIAKAKSMLSEEIGLNHALEAADLEVIETDLGEYIVQLSGDTPSHIIAPIIHKSKDSVRDTLMDKADMPATDDAAEMTHFARGILREKFLQADMGITGGNFIIAETGTIGLVMNEGNGRMVTSLPKVHVALIGIEKIAATVEDYATLTQLLPRSGTGQTLTVYTNMINGPRKPDEVDGPDFVYVILVDNGRSRIYASDYAEALACLRCGACLNACPVYHATGGHAYGWVYSGPIGAVITPLLTGLENATPLPYASSLCGMCKQVCPVDIDLPRMLLDLRHDLVEQGLTDRIWNWGMRGWALTMKSTKLYGAGLKLAAWGTPKMPGNSLPGPLSGWTDSRTMPEFSPKSFRQLWQEQEES